MVNVQIKIEAKLADKQEGAGMGGNSDELCFFVPFWIVCGLKFMSAFGSVHRV